MKKYNVSLELWANLEDIEAENKEEAIKNALIKLTNNPYDYFTAEDKIANKILDNFHNNSTAYESEEE